MRQLSYEPIISFIRDRLDFPMAPYNTTIMYDFHSKLQKKAPERHKNLERLRILIYFCHNSCRRSRRSTWGVDLHPDPFAIPANVWLALLRGVNVGGSHRLPTRELESAFTSAGASAVTTYAQSGNVILNRTVARTHESMLRRCCWQPDREGPVQTAGGRGSPDAIAEGPKTGNRRLTRSTWSAATRTVRRRRSS